MKLRRLNDAGLKQFNSFIEDARMGNFLETPIDLLSIDTYSEDIKDEIVVEQREFSSRYELGVYLVGKFAQIDMQHYLGDVGFWSGLALLWFDQLCPIKSGLRKPSESAAYILSDIWGKKSRHAILTTWQLVEKYGDSSLPMLSKMDSRGELMENLMGTQAYLSCRGVIGAASKLYFDKSRRTFKSGTGGKGGGSARRFIRFLKQLEVNYDLFSLSDEDLLALMPSEFNRFKA